MSDNAIKYYIFIFLFLLLSKQGNIIDYSKDSIRINMNFFIYVTIFEQNIKIKYCITLDGNNCF